MTPVPPRADTALPDDSVVTRRDQTEPGDRAHTGQVLRDVSVTPLALAEGEGHGLGHLLPIIPNKAPSPLYTQAWFSLQHKEEGQDTHPRPKENPLGQVQRDEPELLWLQEGSWEFPFMGVCSSNVYPGLLFDQVPAQSSTLRLVSALLTLPRQPGRDGTGTELSPRGEPQEGLSPSRPASPASTCLRKGHPECHWGVTPQPLQQSHTATSHKSCPGQGEGPRDGTSQSHIPVPPREPLTHR